MRPGEAEGVERRLEGGFGLRRRPWIRKGKREDSGALTKVSLTGVRARWESLRGLRE